MKYLKLFLAIVTIGIIALPQKSANASKWLNYEEILEIIATNLIPVNSQLDDHESRITALENAPSPTPVPTPTTVIFAEERLRPFNSDWIEVSGYSELTMEVYSSISILQYGMHYTNDPANATDTTGFVEQARVWCSGATCPPTTFPILGNYYRFSTGTSEGNITARGYLIP